MSGGPITIDASGAEVMVPKSEVMYLAKAPEPERRGRRKRR